MRARRRWPLLLPAALLLAGCGSGSRPVAPLGRPFSTQPPAGPLVTAAPAPSGDPPQERGGTIPPAAVTAGQRINPRALAPSPAAALRRYALAYVNWSAASLPARERQLAALSIGQARQLALQTASARSGAAALLADQVSNSGQIIALTPGEGPDRNQWVLVTQEHTTGSGPYAALPAGPHVTIARVTHLRAAGPSARGAPLVDTPAPARQAWPSARATLPRTPGPTPAAQTPARICALRSSRARAAASTAAARVGRPACTECVLVEVRQIRVSGPQCHMPAAKPLSRKPRQRSPKASPEGRP